MEAIYNRKVLDEVIDEVTTEMKLIALEQSPQKIKNDINKILKKANQADKTELCKTDNFNVFIVFMNLFNDDKFLYEETLEYCSEAKKAINKWTFEKDGNALLTMEEQTNDDGSLKDFKYINVFTSLGLTPIFSDYKMRLVYTCMYEFLKLKKDILSSNELFQNIPYKNKITMMNTTYQKSQFKVFLEAAKNYILEEERRFNERQEIAKIRLRYTKELKRAIEKEEIDNLTEIPEKWHQYLDPRMLEELYLIVQHNQNIKYKELMHKEKELNDQINKTPLISFLYKHNLNPESLDSEKLFILNNTPNIMKKINFLLNLGIPINNILTIYYHYLINFTEEQLIFYEELISYKALSKESFIRNISIIENSFNKIKMNYDILSRIVDFNNIFYNDSILLEDTINIRNILSILKEYNLSTNNYIFLLCNNQFIDFYDLLIEQEIPDYLFISICKTQDPLSTIKRIMLYKNIDESYTTNNGLLRKEIINPNKYICQNEDLNNYLPNHIEEQYLSFLDGDKIDKIIFNELVTKLDAEYRIDNLYIIGTANISRTKFLKNFERVNGDSKLLVASLVSKSIMDESTYISLITELNNKKVKK